jgi:hypothetical protein
MRDGEEIGKGLSGSPSQHFVMMLRHAKRRPNLIRWDSAIVVGLVLAAMFPRNAVASPSDHAHQAAVRVAVKTKVPLTQEMVDELAQHG